jgi:hypothetical protein
MGTRFSGCPSEDNQILLPHGLFAEESASGGCNDGSVIAQGIEVTNGQCYRSLLNVTVDPLFNNSDILCAHIATNGTRIEIGNSTIRISGTWLNGDSFNEGASPLLSPQINEILRCTIQPSPLPPPHTHTK